MKSIRLCSLLLSTLLPCAFVENGYANEIPSVVKIECESVSAVLAKVDSCSENTIAVESAQKCYDRIVKEWNEAPKDLKSVMSLAKPRENSRQEAEFVYTHGDYKKTITKLNNLLDVSERNSDLLTKYSTAMLRDYDIEEASGPIPCYADNFKKLEKIVWALDDRISEGVTALEAAEQLWGVALDRDGGIDGSQSNGVIHSAYASGAGETIQPYVAGQSPRPSSDITGTRRAIQNEILSDFKIRDQLTGH